MAMQYDVVNNVPGTVIRDDSLYPERQFRRYREGYLDVSQGFRRTGGRKHYTGEDAPSGAVCIRTTDQSMFDLRPERTIPAHAPFGGKLVAEGHRDSHIGVEDGYLKPKATANQYRPNAVVCDGIVHGVTTDALVRRDPVHQRSDKVRAHLAWPTTQEAAVAALPAPVEGRPVRTGGIDRKLGNFDRADEASRPTGGDYDFIARARRIEHPRQSAKSAFYNDVRGRKRVEPPGGERPTRLW